jgi:hypothetical protein
MKIEASFDCNQKEFIEDICWIVYSIAWEEKD